MSSNRPPKYRATGRFDPGRLIAQILCAVFAVFGALPLAAGYIARSDAAEAWVSRETTRVLRDLLGIEARYQIQISLLPLEIALEDVRVESNDGAEPAIQVARVGITPRVFSLIAGRLDIGDIEIERAEHHLVIEDGVVTNLSVRLPETSGGGMDHAPFRSLSATDTRFDVLIDGIHVETGPIDLDVFTEGPDAVELAIRMGESRIAYPEDTFESTRTDGVPGTFYHWDEDVICQVDARVRIDPDGILVRRVSMSGSADIESDFGTEPQCPTTEEGEPPRERVQLRSSQLRVVTDAEGGLDSIEGSIEARLPAELLNRVTGGAPSFSGWLSLDGEARYDADGRLPQFDGKVQTGEFHLAGRRLSEGSEGEVRVVDDHVLVDHMHVVYGGGPVDIYDVDISPFDMALEARKVDGRGVPFAAIMRDIGITPNTIVHWMVDRAIVTNFKGSLEPPRLDGDVVIDTSQFEVFDRAYHNPARQHMIGAKPKAQLRGRFGIRNDSIQFNRMDIRFGASHLDATVHLGFDNWILIDVPQATINLAEISPLVTVPISGQATLDAHGSGKMDDPLLEVNLGVKDLVFGGFPLGDLDAPNTRFQPLWVELDNAQVRKGKSVFKLPSGRLDFETDASIQADLRVASKNADVRDFLAMWRFEQDPRWLDLEGNFDADARVRYVLGGKRDTCGGGNLRVNGHAEVRQLTLFDEQYDDGRGEFAFHWQDMNASYHGMSLELPSLQLHKGAGTIIGSVGISPGAKLRGNMVATAIPLSKLTATRKLDGVLSGTISGVGKLGGSVDEMEIEARASSSALVLGRSKLPASQVDVQLKPNPSKAKFAAERTRCGNRIPSPFDPGASQTDEASGVFHVDGQLFGQQVMFDKFSVTRQRRKVAKGGLIFNELDLRPLLELLPDLTTAKQRPAGKLSGRLDLARMPLDELQATQGIAEVGSLWVTWKGFRVSTDPIEALTLSSGSLSASRLAVHVATPAGRTAEFDVTGAVRNITKRPTFDLDVSLRPVELKAWAMLMPDLSQVEGQFSGRIKVVGPLSNPTPLGKLQVDGGRFVLRQQGLAFNDVDVRVGLEQGAIVLQRARAAVGGGFVEAGGRLPLVGMRLGEFRGQVRVNSVSVPVAEGVKLAVDANLDASWNGRSETQDEAPLPRLSGTVDVKSFEYSRPVTMNADIANLARRGKRTEFESYDPAKDVVELDVLVRADRALRLNNNLIDASLRIERPGLQLTGTNQRFGLRGRMRIEPGGRIRMRRNEFEVESGEVRFDDPATVAPRVDLRANTEYRRYSSSTSTSSNPPAGGNAAETGSTSGQWRITMHAYGDADNLKIDLTSQPKLSQDDIFLLLTVGLTRTELDQAQSASLGESVALEALGSLTGADSAVTDAIPVIDEFRFGSSYSSRTGRTEPTVTVGKRLTERIRAYVTSGISESREVRSNLEWRLNQRVSVEGSYDNVNDISSSNLGNLGADVRWRLEFE